MKRLVTRPVLGLLHRIGYDLVRLPNVSLLRSLQICSESSLSPLPLVVENLVSKGRPISFMQIGANDGVRDDPFRRQVLRYNLRGILVEPQSGAFEDLRRNYAGQPNLVFENVAISAGARSLTLFAFDRVEENGMRLDVFTSPHRTLLDQWKRKLKVAAEVVSLTVPAVTVEELLDKHSIHDVTLFIIDTEGYDYEIIKTVDLERNRPLVIQFEHRLLEPGAREASYRYLVERGYTLFPGAQDTCAFSRELWEHGEP